MIGTLLSNRYRIEAKVGEGGMGVVYRAQDTLLNRPVAIKMLSPHLLGDEGVKRLLREAQAAAQLTHPNIVAVYDVIEEREARLIVMEFVDGHPLASLVPLDVPRAVHLITQVCRALQYAHSRGIVHRDIKPENIIVTADDTAKLMDFGLARSEGRSRMTQSGLIVGTVAYMAPEQVLGGAVDARSDLYSLGCVLYEALTGRKPFEGDDPFTVLSQQVNVMPVAPRWHNDGIPPTLDAIVMRLLTKDPAERYESAAALTEALELIAAPEAETAAVPVVSTTRTTLLERIVRGKLVGRAAELAELREHLDRMLSGEGRMVMVSGEPGIGKTRLAEELAVYAHLRGAWVLRGQCYEQEVGVPYLPVMESLRQLHRVGGQTTLVQLGDRIDDLARLLPEVGRRRQESVSLTPEDERIRVFDAATQWLGLASRMRPLVFILDDLHWADRASLRLLHQLARGSRTERVLLLGTYREMELDVEHPLNDVLNQMNRERLYYRLPLRRLSEEDTRTLLSGLFDSDISGELAGAVYRETEGNPFFIEEVVKALVEEGKIYREGGRWQRLPTQELEIPQSVKAAIGRRLQKASEPARRILTIAAVMGREFNPEVIVQVSGLGEDAVLDALDEATRLQLIREVRLGRETGYTFEHALIRQTLYESLNARRRARLHQQVGEALEVLYRTRRDDHLEELAYHFGEAGPAAASKGIEYNLLAARKAASLYAMEEGERRLMVALELAEGSGDSRARAGVLEALGDLYLLFMDARATQAYRRSLDIATADGGPASDDVVRLYCRVAEATASWQAESSPETLRYAQDAVNLLEDRPDSALRTRALSLLAIHHTRAGQVEEARTPAAQAVDLAGRLGDQHELSMAYRALAMVHRYANEWDRFREVVQRRRALLGTTFTPADADLYVDLVHGYLMGGNPAEAEGASREFLETAEKLHSPTAIYRAYSLLVASLFSMNKWDELLHVADKAVQLGERLHSLGLYAGRASLFRSGMVLAARAEDERAREQIARLETIQHEIPPEHVGARQFALEVALILDAHDLMARLLPRVEQEQPRCLSCTFTFRMIVAEAQLRLGNIAAARARLEEAQRSRPERLAGVDVADFARLRGRLAEASGDLDAAVQYLEESLAVLAPWPMNLYHALYREDTARVYLSRGGPGDLERGRQLLGEAIELYRTVAAKRLEARAKQVLASAGSTP